MKKKLVLVFLIFSVFQSKAQLIESKSLIGKTFVVDTLNPMLREYGYSYFVKDINKDLSDPSNTPFPDKRGIATSYDSLVNKRFLCVDAGKVPSDSKFYLKLQNQKLGVLYFIYARTDDKLEYLYSQEDRAKEQADLTAEKMDEVLLIKNPCLTIEKEDDEYYNATTFSTPFMSMHTTPSAIPGINDPEWYNVKFSKIIKKGSVKYTCYLYTTVFRPLLYAKGVVILLKNGKKINKPNILIKNNVNAHDKFEVYADIGLTADDRALLKTSEIKGFALSSEEAPAVRSDELYKMFVCLLDKK